ncbi:DUF4082 domain-containing protein [Microbispora sp. NBC_01189]|uniref:DUF4082 domain-containing protein n=1 Tax=Microbispora sp. NBC_01189 TaxID=2903583 RepID=UPI002E12C053|nr:DUF4082 domain-containing protein [Microbispora sp. NBC_01189]
MARSSRRAGGRRSRLPGLVSLLAACAVGGVAVTVILTNRSPETSLGPTVPVAQERILQASFAPEPREARPRRDPMPVEVGMRFVPQIEGQVVALRFLKARGDSGRHIGSLWSDRGALLARVTFSSETSRGWQEARLSAPVALEAGRTYTVSYNSGAGRYVAQRGVFTRGPLEAGPLVAPAERNGVFSYGRPAFPRRSNRAGYNYFVDVVFRYTTAVPDPAAEESVPPTSVPADPQEPGETPEVPVTPALPDDTATTTPEATPTVIVPATPRFTPRYTPRATPAATPGRPDPTATSEPSKPTQAPPPVTGFPDASTTGPAKGTVFTRMKGGELRQNGAVYDGVEITDSIDVYADNVTLRNCRIITTGEWGVQLRNGHTNLVVDHCEIAGDGRRQLAVAVKNIGDGDITIRGNDIHDATDAINTGRGTIEGNYIHDLRAFTGDHVDGIQTEGSSGSAPLVIKNNTILNPVGQTSAIMLATSLGPVTNVLIQGNLIGGGGYCFYGGGDKAGSSRNVVVRDNVFSRSLFSNCGAYGPVAHFDRSAPGNVWQNNVWQGTRNLVEL